MPHNSPLLLHNMSKKAAKFSCFLFVCFRILQCIGRPVLYLESLLKGVSGRWSWHCHLHVFESEQPPSLDVAFDLDTLSPLPSALLGQTVTQIFVLFCVDIFCIFLCYLCFLINMNIWKSYICELRRKHEWNLILTVCYQLKVSAPAKIGHSEK